MSRDNVIGQILGAVFAKVPIAVDRSMCPTCGTIGVRVGPIWRCINCGHEWDGGDGAFVVVAKGPKNPVETTSKELEKP